MKYFQVCSTIPEPALIIKGECTFDRDACGWRNTTTVSPHLWFCQILSKSFTRLTTLTGEWQPWPRDLRICQTKPMELQLAMHTSTSSTRAAGYNWTWHGWTQYPFPGRIGWRWSHQRSQQASLARCASLSGSLPSVPETQPAWRYTSKGGGTYTGCWPTFVMIFLCDFLSFQYDMIGFLMMGRRWIGWTTTMMISSGKISAKARMRMRTRTSHQ